MTRHRVAGSTTLWLVLLVLEAAAGAATVPAASCSRTHVQQAIAAASPGDTVELPACACGSVTWSSELELSKSVTIKGQGPAATCLRGRGFITVNGVNSWRITGIRWNSAGGEPQVLHVTSGTPYEGTPITGWMIDNNTFDGYGGTYEISTIRVANGSTGVIANNLFTSTRSTDSVIYVNGRDNADWAAPAAFGTATRYVFIEDNKFVTSLSNSNHVVMGRWGVSYVFRCNELGYAGSGTYKDMIDAHGFGHGAHRRATRAFEVYGNHLSNNNYGSRTMNYRGGSGMVFSNRWTRQSSIGLTDYRMINTGQAMQYPADPKDCGSSTMSSLCPASAQASCCASHEGYPCCDQIGRGMDSPATPRQTAHPLHLWDNQTDGGAAIPVTPTAAFIQKGRDFIVDVVPGGYAPFTYPHPARGMPPTTTCLADASSQAKTGITFWTAGPPAADGPAPADRGGSGGDRSGAELSPRLEAGQPPDASGINPVAPEGCGCQLAAAPQLTPAAWLLLLLALATTRARRRARRARLASRARPAAATPR